MWPFDKKQEPVKPLDLLPAFTCPAIADSEKVALVLMGGGEKGRFQAGQLKWLEQIGLLKHVKIIVGTSVGGLNALSLAKNKMAVDPVLDMWAQIRRNEDVYDGKLDVWGFMKMVTIKCKSILNQQGLYRILNKYFKGMKLKDFGIDIAITATNLSRRRAEVFSSLNNPEFDAVLAGAMTSALPAGFQYQVWNGDKYCDGGVLNNTPIATAIEMGATKVIMVGTGPRELERQDIKDDGMSVILATVNVMLDFPESEMWKDIKDRFPSVEILKMYADKDTGAVAEFGRLELLDQGYKTAAKYITEAVVSEWAK